MKVKTVKNHPIGNVLWSSLNILGVSGDYGRSDRKIDLFIFSRKKIPGTNSILAMRIHGVYQMGSEV